MKKRNLKNTSIKIIASFILIAQLFSAVSAFGPRSGGVQTMGEFEEDTYSLHRF